MQNQRVVLASRPTAAPSVENFRVERAPLRELQDGEVLIKTLYLSLDPYMRMRMNDTESYAEPVAIDEVMYGGTVGRILASRRKGFSEGDLVTGYTGWQSLAVTDDPTLMRLPRDMPQPSLALSLMGMPGFTAYYGLLKLGKPEPGQTVVVGAATGAVGSVVGQIAKLKGCRAVGIAGGADKCAFAVEALGFDACIDHRSADFGSKLKAACPGGVDVYFENVGGEVLRNVLPLLKDFARIPLCGAIAWYDGDRSENPLLAADVMTTLLIKRIQMSGFVIIDHYLDHYSEFAKDMQAWLAQGKMKLREDLVEGLDKAPEAFIGLLKGKNFGKVVVRVAED
ncbi:MAG: NADP-dependent oxidoreductase [Panacagrimonas sp.]